MTKQDLQQIDELLTKKLDLFEGAIIQKLKQAIGDSEAVVISSIQNHYVRKDEFKSLENRVTKLEKSLEY